MIRYLHYTPGTRDDHVKDTDCWCEPPVIWVYGDPFVAIAFVHHSVSSSPHDHVLEERTKNPDWVTQTLEEIG